LDVTDIEGACADYKFLSKQGIAPRDPKLNVRDINAEGKKELRTSPDFWTKGHPEGPKDLTHVRPRGNPTERDNSLRTADIHGLCPR
jgi:hypothetical protein